MLPNSFLEVIESPVDGTAKNNVFGTAFSLGASNSMGSYVQVIDGSTAWPSGIGDGYWIRILIHTVGSASALSNSLVTIGIDLAGGASYTDWIQNLLVSGALQSAPNGGDGVYYDFPIRVPNGASLAVKGQSANAAPTTPSYCAIKIFCKPTRPELMRVGTFVQSFGVDTANSAGTSITPGGASEGAYVQLGSALDKEIFYWEFGWGSSSTSFAATVGEFDVAVGDASNKRRVIRNGRLYTYTSEQCYKPYRQGEYGPGAISDLVYGRCQGGDNAMPANNSMAAYGVGG